MKPHQTLRSDAVDVVLAVVLPVAGVVLVVTILTVVLVILCAPFALAFSALRWWVTP